MDRGFMIRFKEQPTGDGVRTLYSDTLYSDKRYSDARCSDT